MAEDSKRLINLRVSEEERQELKAAGALAGRSLPNEILHRLGLGDYRQGTAGRPDRAIADLVAIVAARSERALDTLGFGLWIGDGVEGEASAEGSVQRARLLAVVREAIVKVLNDLGAASSSETTVTPEMIAAVTWDLATRIKAPNEKDPEGQTLARIARGLGFRKPSGRKIAKKGNA